MKLAIIGGSGLIGSRVLDEALARGHDVTVIGRRTGVYGDHDNLTEVAVDIQDPRRLDDPPPDRDRLSRVLAGHDVVISCFNPGHDLKVNPNIYGDFMEGARVIIDAVKRSGVPRMIFLGGAASLNSVNRIPLVDDFELFSEMVHTRPPGAWMPEDGPDLDIPRAARMALYLFERERELDWIFVSPSLYIGDYGGGTGVYRTGFGTLLLGEDGRKSARLDIADMGRAMVDQAEEPTGSHLHLTFATVWPEDEA